MIWCKSATNLQYKLVIFFLFFSFYQSSIALEKSLTQDRLTLVYSSDFRGELKPCGCTEEGNLGGILRRATKFSVLRSKFGSEQRAKIKKAHQNILFVSAGDILSSGDEQALIKAQYILEGQHLLNLDAILPGEKDIQHKISLLKKFPLPWVLTNRSKKLPFDDHQQRFLKTGRRVLIFGLLQPELLNRKKQRWLHDPSKSLKAAFIKTKAHKDDIIILLLHGNDDFIKRFQKISLIDVFVRGHLQDIVSSSPSFLNRPVLSAGYRGQRFGIATLKINQSTSVINNEVISLPKTIQDHPKLSHLYENYNKEISLWYKNKTAKLKSVEKNLNPYVGAKICHSCHTNEFNSWGKSSHANAIKSLQTVNKHEDPECLICHTTGMGKFGGFISATKNAEFSNVQCEACHAAGRKHAEFPQVNNAAMASQKCVTCHTREHSPNFQFANYWPKITHHKTVPLPIHQQSISKIFGFYEVLDPQKPMVNKQPVVMTEYFNFYCSRCYVFNAGFPKILDKLPRKIIHQQIPIIFGEQQQAWASLAYLVAKQNGKGPAFKAAVFTAKFEQNLDISDQQTIINIATRFKIRDQVIAALNDDNSAVKKKFQDYQQQKEEDDIHATPNIIINNNLQVLPKHTGNNTNLMLENLREILLDLQQRQQK